MSSNGPPFEVLLVDDDPGDLQLMREALGEWRTRPKVTEFEDGEEALKYLEARCSAGPAGGMLLLLDLNMPGTDGREVLRRMKESPGLKEVPVIILTTSASPVDIRACYAQGANAYIVKPLELPQLLTVARRLQDFWIDTAALPGEA